MSPADTDAKSYLSHSPKAVLASTEGDKKKYCDACSTFTPLYFSVDGLAGDEATCQFYLASTEFISGLGAELQWCD